MSISILSIDKNHDVNASKTTKDLIYHLQKNVFAFSQSQRQRAKDIDVINRRFACDVI